MDNAFILQLIDKNIQDSFRKRILAGFIKFINTHNRYLKLKFKDDRLNVYYGIKNSPIYDTKENKLKSKMISVEQGMNIHHLLCQVLLLRVPGEVVELGCFEGITSVLMQKTLDQFRSKKRIHVYDSFQGLPDKQPEDGDVPFVKGKFRSPKSKLIKNFGDHNTKLPIIHTGWFKDTLPKGLPKVICFAHLDGDLYSSITESLEYVYPKLAKGAIVVVDDYCDPNVLNVNNILPGVKKACDDFLSDKKEKMSVLIAGCESHGYLRKL